MDDNCQCAVKLYVKKLIDRMNRLGVVTEPSNGSQANIINHFRGDSSDVVTRSENEDDNDNTTSDDGDGQSPRGNVRLESDVDKFEKDLNDLQKILNVVVNLVRCSMNGNLPHATIDFLRTFSTSIRRKMANLKDTCKKSLTHKGEMPRMNVGLKRVRDTDECAVEHNVSKKPRTEDDKHDESSFVERKTSVAKESIDNYSQSRKTFKSTAATRTENNNIQRKFEFSKIVVHELKPYYKQNQFVTIDLFQFMAKSIVHKLLDSTIGPAEYTIKLTIRKMMVEKKIESKIQILTLLKQFF